MNVFVETNFVMELALKQGEVQDASTLLELAADGKIKLKIPAFALIEPRYKLTSTRAAHRDLSKAIDDQLKEIVRTAGYEGLRDKTNDLRIALASKADLDLREYESVVGRLLEIAEVIPLNSGVIVDGRVRQLIDLEPPDALIFASVRRYLDSDHDTESVFANKDVKGFHGNRLVVEELHDLKCTVIPTFSDTLAFLTKRKISF